MRSGIRVACLLALAIGSVSCGSRGGVPISINRRAALRGNLPWDPLRWNVITSLVDQRQSTMSTLYGNPAAVSYARTRGGSDYPAGCVLSLVTWTQQPDPHWFGARIPADVKSVEFVSVDPGASSYEIYTGSPLARSSTPEDGRAEYLRSLRAAVMP